MEIRENYEKRERVYSNYEQINILLNIKQLKQNIKYSNFEVSRQMFESLSNKSKNSFRAATQGQNLAFLFA